MWKKNNRSEKVQMYGKIQKKIECAYKERIRRGTALKQV